MNKKEEKSVKILELRKILEDKGDKISKATKVKSLLQKQKSLIRSKKSLTDFQEPVLDLHRRDGTIETFEKATSGKFIFEHSTGKPRFIEIRPSDQETRDYAGRKVRWYTAHEDRPFAGWESPIVDGETVMLGYEKTKATDSKYQAKMEELKNQGRLSWVWWILGIAGAIAIIGFAYATWINPALIERARATVANNVTVVQELPKTAVALFLLKFRKKGVVKLK